MKQKILFIAPGLNGFIKNDIHLLSDDFTLHLSVYNWYKKSLLPFNLLRQLFLLLTSFHRFDKVLIQFGGYWSLLPALFGNFYRKEVFIILHGTDTAAIPPINYGSLRKPLLRFFCKWSYHYATQLLPVSESLIHTINTFSFDDFKLQGVKNHFPSNNTPYTVIHNGLDQDFWKQKNESMQECTFVSVFTMKQFILKGGDLILSVAKERPEFTFYLVGISKTQLTEYKLTIPPNVVLMGMLDRDALKGIYMKCQFHLQLSIFEGFGLALCEAMLCGCVPIGSSVNMIPEIIGNTGYILKKKDKEALLQLMDRAIQEHNSAKRINARERIISNYSNEKRKSALINVLSQ